VVRDVHRLLVPPSAAGPTALRVGIYDPETGARLPAGDASGRSLPDDAATIPYPWTPGRDG
jgi:hypothetical protein